MNGSVLVTGADGFVGQALCEHLQGRGITVRKAVREGKGRTDVFTTGSIDADTDWQCALKGCTGVVHLAARVHITRDRAEDPLAAFRSVNVDATLVLAEQAAAAGVKRFIFLSSIKVNGEETEPGKPFSHHDRPQPLDFYGVSKWEAEQGLQKIGARTNMEFVVIRPPLVYGPGVKANFRSMMKWLDKGVPLPLGSVTQNRRSLIALGNLVHLVATCLEHPCAAGRTFLACDGEDMSTAQLLQRMAVALGKPARLIPVPPALVFMAASMLGRKDIAKRLLGSLQVDSSQLSEVLGWAAPVSVDQALMACAREYKI